jgi:hypothetical protein
MSTTTLRNVKDSVEVREVKDDRLTQIYLSACHCRWVPCLKSSMSVTAALGGQRYFVRLSLKPGEIYELRTKVVSRAPCTR